MELAICSSTVAYIVQIGFGQQHRVTAKATENIQPQSAPIKDVRVL